MSEASVNNVGDSPGSLKLRDVACIRQNDQLRSLYGLVHVVSVLCGDQSVTLAPDDGGGSFDPREVSEHSSGLAAVAILLARGLLGTPDDVVEDEARQVAKVGARNVPYRLAAMQTGIVSASVPSKSKITPLIPIAPSLAGVSAAPDPQRC